ncbi:MAG: PEP-CTERM sorting domain-containing protein, partial [Gemmataceae bacterium]|nr:PEP-CTERM sorting domain-containing protein [Gemmataceae bacterium]
DPARYEIRPALYVSSYDYQLRIVSNGINGGSALVLTMVPVPEPTGVLAIIAFLGLGFWFRQRRQRNHQEASN